MTNKQFEKYYPAFKRIVLDPWRRKREADLYDKYVNHILAAHPSIHNPWTNFIDMREACCKRGLAPLRRRRRGRWNMQFVQVYGGTYMSISQAHCIYNSLFEKRERHYMCEGYAITKHGKFVDIGCTMLSMREINRFAKSCGWKKPKAKRRNKK